MEAMETGDGGGQGMVELYHSLPHLTLVPIILVSSSFHDHYTKKKGGIFTEILNEVEEVL
jgi:hypothetical protein